MTGRHDFFARFGRIVRRDQPLARFTTFGIGGAAEMLAEVSTVGDLVELVKCAGNSGIAVMILGEGSNVLVGDGGADGLVIVNRCRRISRDGDFITAEAGARLNDVVDFAIEHGLAGLEMMAGIPGTVGGAVVGNAGAYGQSIADVLTYVELLQEDGEVVRRQSADLGFAYRTSRLRATHEVVLSAEFGLASESPDVLRQRAAEVREKRREKLPPGLCCAGSYFKNIVDPTAPNGKIPAGKLLDEAGAKSFRVGQAVVSEKHANVIVNLGGATAADVLALAKRMKHAVQKEFGIELEEEVRFVGKLS